MVSASTEETLVHSLVVSCFLSSSANTSTFLRMQCDSLVQFPLLFQCDFLWRIVHPQCGLVRTELVPHWTQTHRLVFRCNTELFNWMFGTTSGRSLLRRRDSSRLKLEIDFGLEPQLPHILDCAHFPLYFRLNVLHFTLLAHLGIQSK